MSSDRSLFELGPPPVLHNRCNKGHGVSYPVCGMVHIKDPSLLIEKVAHKVAAADILSLSEWSVTICLTPYNRNEMC